MGQSVNKRFDSLVKYCSVSLRGSVKKKKEMEECAFRLASIIKRHQPQRQWGEGLDIYFGSLTCVNDSQLD